MSQSDPSVVIFGAGAIGCSVGGWIAPHVPNLSIFARGDAATALADNGLVIYAGSDSDARETHRLNVLTEPADLRRADILLLAVKNWQLDSAVESIKPHLRDDALVVGIQNGIENQTVLPQHFQRIVYAIAGYNAWLDAPGIVGYQRRGPLLLGTPDNSLQDETKELVSMFSPGVETLATDRFQDAAHSKIIINLTNSFTTLIGHRFQEVTAIDLVQRILANLIYEGIQVLKAAGYRQHRIPGTPGWELITASARLPQFLTRQLFLKNLKKMVVSSMAQDVIVRGNDATELDSINGRILELANKHNVAIPYNETVYSICQERFAADQFVAMDVRDVWKAIEERIKELAK